MRFNPDLLDDIRDRLPPSAVIGKRIRLKRVGHTWKGICPWHADHTPSFEANDQKGKFFCNPCQASGDVFGFLMRMDGCSFPEAVERLAADAGVTLPALDPESTAREARKLSLIEVVGEADKFFRDQLHSAAGAAARAYLSARSITGEMIERFGIGFAPDDRSALKSHLVQAGVEQADLIEAGLIIAGADIPVSYDRFRARVMFPIRDGKGRPVGFGGRALAKDAQAKYLNSPEGPLFDKGRLLYNADRAREPAWNGEPLLAVEGYTATIMAASNGFPATVAPMGTALTAEGLRSLWRMSDEPIICFDGDGAGQKAIRRVIENALPLLMPGRWLKFAYLPSGVDPDDLIRQRGAGAFKAIVSGAMGLVDALWRAETDGRSISGPDDRAALEKRLVEAVDVIPSPQHRAKYVEEYRKRVRSLGAPLKMQRSNSNSHHSASPGSIRLAHGVRKEPMPLRDAMLVSAMIAAPATALTVMEKLSEDQTLSVEASAAVRGILDVLSELPDADAEALKAALIKAGANGTIEAAQDICHRAGITSLDHDGEAVTAVLTHH